MPYLSDAELLTAVTACLKKAEMEVDSPWQDIVARANRKAKGQIKRSLVARGYSVAQVEDWEDLQEFNENLGLYWALTLGGVAADFDDKFIKSLDRAEELARVMVLIDSELAAPDNPGRVRSGPMADPDDAIFTMDFED